MGEIADALRRAGTKNKADEVERPIATPRASSLAAPAAPAAPAGSTHSRVAAPTGPPAHLPEDREVDWESRAVTVEGDGPIAESFRHLALRLQRELPPRVRSVAVMSAVRGEGKTTIACNLALALASLSRDRDIALLDLDLRRPTIAARFGLHPTVGVDDVLERGVPLHEVRQSIDRPLLDVYSVRTPRDAAHEMLLGAPFEAMLRELEQRYRLVIVDTPPVVLVPDGQIITQHTGTCLVVARHRHSRARTFKTMLDHLPKGKVLGAIWNEGRLVTGAESYYYYETSQAPVASS